MEILASEQQPEGERHISGWFAAGAALALTAELILQTSLLTPTPPPVEAVTTACGVPTNLAQEFAMKPDYATVVGNYRDDTYTTTPTQFRAIGVRYDAVRDKWYNDTYKTRPLPITEAFADSQFDKLQAEERQVASAVLKEIGIEVDARKFPDSNLTELLMLTTVPKSIIAASGLKKIVLEPRAENRDDRQFFEPKHKDGTLYVPNYSYDINTGIAAMILDNACTPDERKALYQRMTTITHQAGKRYGYLGIDPNKASQDEFTKFWDKGHYEDVFAANFTFNSARAELVTLISHAINGYNFYDDLQKKTPVAEKLRIAQFIVDRIDPKLKTAGEYSNYNGVWRSFNQHPFDAANYLVEMNNAEAHAKTDPKSAAIVDRNQDESYSPETAGDWPPDNTYDTYNAPSFLFNNFTPPEPPATDIPDFLKFQY